MRVLIASTYVPFIKGGGTKIVDDLHRELTLRGFETDTVMIPLRSSWPEIPEQTAAMRLLDLTECAGNKIDRLITIRYPAYALRHPDKVAWFIHHYREAYDLWGTKWGGMPDNTEGRHYRNMMHRSDDIYLRECRKVFALSKNLSRRLKEYNSLEPAGVLYAPLPEDHSFRPGPFGDYLFYASRLTPIKRQSLAIEAMKYTDPEVKLVLGGAADLPSYFGELADLIRNEGLSDRIRLTGWISEEEKVELMSGCCGAMFLGYDEDYCAYVTLEAFHSGKPVITLTDSGGSLEVIRDGHNGYVTDPDPRALADAMNRLWKNRSQARQMGERALRTIDDYQINWDHVVENLTS